MNISLHKTFAMIAALSIMLSFSTNPPNGKTGAPGNGICIECHNPQSGSIDGFQTIEGIPETVIPGQIYNLKISNSYTTGSPVRSGFQLLVLDESNSNAGEFSNNEMGTAISNEFGRTYFEHAPAKFFQTDTVVNWTTDWQAPDGPVGDSITFYSAGIIGNGSQSSGDKLITARVKTFLDMPSSIANDLHNEFEWTVYPNPATNYIDIAFTNENTDSKLSIFDSWGRMILSQTIYNDDSRVNTESLQAGFYQIQILNRNGIFSRPLIIQ